MIYNNKKGCCNEPLVWDIIDEWMQTIQITNPRLHDAVMKKIEHL